MRLKKIGTFGSRLRTESVKCKKKNQLKKIVIHDLNHDLNHYLNH